MYISFVAFLLIIYEFFASLDEKIPYSFQKFEYPLYISRNDISRSSVEVLHG